ncbi:hypothetical protein EV426DRAFT_585454 [Tirmania nivea]|nr:hypothetical protein EV426DRAFT_585454 [Tirmania nivea]
MKIWREKMFQALILFYQDAREQPKLLSNLLTSHKVSKLRAFLAIRVYDDLLKQMREARAAFKAAELHAQEVGMAEVLWEIRMDLHTVEYRMECFIMKGEIPKDRNIDVMLIRNADEVSNDTNSCFEGMPESLHSYSDNSGFFDIPEDYDPAPFNHRLLQPLLLAKEGLERLAQTLPPNSASNLARRSLENITNWRREMRNALAAFHRDVSEPSTFRNITTGGSSKVKVVRVLFAIRCYATLVKEIGATKQAMLLIDEHQDFELPTGIMLHDWLAGWEDLVTVELDMNEFFLK